ncbi:MAG: peptidase [Betaproteobacteria bacterium]|nr:peptidase [Betaproteobacteria bacterium]
MRALVADFAVNLRCGLRAMLLRRVALDECRISPDQLVLLVCVILAARLLLDIGFNGLDGYFNVYALSAEITLIAALLLAAFIAGRLTNEPRLLLGYPIILLAMEPFFVALQELTAWAARSKPSLVSPAAWSADTAFIAWFLVAALVVLLRLAPGRRLRAGAVFAGYCALLAGSFWWLPQEDLWMARASAAQQQASIADEAAFHAQPALLERDLAALEPERPGIADIYFVGFAAYAHEDVFMKEIHVIGRLFRERFDAEGRTIALINNPKTAKEVPLASVTNLARVLRHIGSVMNREEDILVLYVTSHGTEKHRLSVVNSPLKLNDITPATLKRALDDSGIKWRVLAISACYAGGFIAPFKDETTLIMTAADAVKPSFGCGTESEFTFFGKAVFDEELRRTHSFTEAFARARRSIVQREREQKFEPSNPQIHVGGAMAQKLRELEARLRALHAGGETAQPDT